MAAQQMTVERLARKMRTHMMGGDDTLAWDEAAETLWGAKAEHLWGEVERNLTNLGGDGGLPTAPEELTEEQWDRFVAWSLRGVMQALED